jgi:cytochrome c oxidase cbb3-type subunit III
MPNKARWLALLFFCLGLFSALPAMAAEEEPLLNVYLEGRNIEQAAESLIQAINSNNYTYVRQQAVDGRLVPADWKANAVRIIYFCNFDLMSRALALDTRTAEFLPCRITLIETAKGVDLLAVNPAWVSNRLGNYRLHEFCVRMKKDYLTIMKEAAL